MGTEYTAEDLLERVPLFVEGISRLQTRDHDALVVLRDEVGLESFERFATPGQRRVPTPAALPRFDFAVQGDADPGLERKLRSAVTRRVGKPAGTAKHWDAGRFEVGITCIRRVGMTLIPVFSVEEVRIAAQLWLSGMAFDEWLTAAGIDTPEGITAGPRPGSNTRITASPARAYVRTPHDRPASASLNMAAMRRVTGTRPANDEESFGNILQFLIDELGDPTIPSHLADIRERWVSGTREFAITSGRAGARTVDFEPFRPDPA
mgnify:FL=1